MSLYVFFACRHPSVARVVGVRLVRGSLLLSLVGALSACAMFHNADRDSHRAIGPGEQGDVCYSSAFPVRQFRSLDDDTLLVCNQSGPARFGDLTHEWRIEAMVLTQDRPLTNGLTRKRWMVVVAPLKK